MNPRLKEMVDKIKDEALRQKASDFLSDLSVEIEGRRYSGMPLEETPGGFSEHHGYRGGLIDHIASSANIALAMCDSVERVYNGKVNRDLVISSILLHDVLKCLTYRIREDGTCRTSELGEEAHHLALLFSELIRRDFPLDVIHTATARLGKSGSVPPRTVEALIRNLADTADAQLNGGVVRLARSLIREAAGFHLVGMSTETALEILHSKTTGGSNGLLKTIEKIKRSSEAASPSNMKTESE